MKGFVFTFDALFALLLVSAIVPLIIFLSPSYDRSIGFQADSALDSFSELRVRNVVMEPVIADLYRRNVLTSYDLERPVLEVVADLWASNSSDNITIAKNITENLVQLLVPSNAQWSLSMENETLFDTGGDARKTSVTGRRVASGFLKGSPSAGYVASVFLTSIDSKKASSYYFFGGFVGQGNITAKIYDIPVNSTVSEIYLELNAGENFTLYANNMPCASVNVTGNFSVNNLTADCNSAVVAGGENNFTINFTGRNMTNEYLGGGYLRVSYFTNNLIGDDSGFFYYRFPGINGLINLYDSFYVPGNITAMEANITFVSGTNYTTLLTLGNVTVLNHTGTGSTINLNISNTTFQQKFSEKGISYIDLSSTTVPLRMVVLANITGGTLNGTSDVVLITDLSGSMGDQLNRDGSTGNIINDCSNSSLYSSTTSRISLAKCLDKTFANTILGNTSICGGTPVVGNRIGLVSFSTSVNSWENLTNNISYLESKIDTYSANGYTCISCAINQAYEILATQSSANRSKYIVVMTDGEANRRSTGTCYNLNDLSGNMSVGDDAAVTRTPPWKAAPGGANFNSVNVFNATMAVAVTDSGVVYQWNGSAWSLQQNLGSYNLYGVDIFNSTFGFAVGSSAKLWRWNGSLWSETNDFGNFNFRSVAFVNSTLAFAVGDSGVIYRWNGVWSLLQDMGNADLYAVDAIPGSAFAVGTSGKIYQWTGTTWSESTDTGSNTHYDVSILNSTKAFVISSNGRVYEWSGSSWSNTLLSSYALRGVYVANSTLAYATGDGRGDIYEWNGTTWSRTGSSFYYDGTSTTGVDCSDDYSCSLSVSESYPSLNANYSIYRAARDLSNLTADAVGFGPIATCALGNQTVEEIAKSGLGTAYSSANATELRNIYCQIAQNIITKTTATQQLIPQGSLQPLRLSPNSYIRFKYVAAAPQASYQEITFRTETNNLPGCDGTLFLPPQIKVVDALRTSYSGFYWTKNMFLQNSVLTNVYNLSKYGNSYVSLGDPFEVYLPVSLLAYNQTNVVRNELGLNSSFLNVTCSHNDRIIYTGRIRASVPYGSVFPELKGGVVRVYYDMDRDGASDGYTDIVLGSDLPGFDPTIKTVDQLDPQNALDDALLRLLESLNFIPGTGIAGSQTNPIDIKLSDVNVAATGTGGIPFAWGPIDIRLDVRI